MRRKRELLVTAILIGILFGIIAAQTIRAAPDLRFVTVRSGDWVRVKGQRLECMVAPDSVYCIELGGFPRLSFLATTTGGATGKGEFMIHRWKWSGDQAETLAQIDRRK